MNSPETIAAISSAVGPAARMIVRVSGSAAGELARRIIANERDTTDWKGGAAVQCRVWPGVAAWVYWFVAPRSYTGEDLVELHLPGSPLLARMVLERLVRDGARHAEPGEFTARAYFNGRMDLTQAEGVACTIAAQSERELRAARQLLAGELARRLQPVMDELAQTLALVEVGIDFSDEDVTFLSADQVRERCARATAALSAILQKSARFERLSHEPAIVLVGRPNAGKSTLLNALAGSERAVVCDVAGTTRDAIWAQVRLPRGMARIIDVAGFEKPPAEEAETPQQQIERQMQSQARRAMEEADAVVWVEEAGRPEGRMEVGRGVDLAVRTKVDLLGSQDDGGEEVVVVSAKTGEGLAELRARLDRLAFGAESGAGLAINSRHVTALSEAIAAIGRAVEALGFGSEIVAMELREALDSLGSVVGKISPDDLLGLVFSRFCIGK